MLKKIVFSSLFISLAFVIAWTFSATVNKQQVHISDQRETASNHKEQAKLSARKNQSTLGDTNRPVLSTGTDISWADKIAAAVAADLNANRWNAAVNRINDNYSKASVTDLAKFKSIVAQHIDTLIENKSDSAASGLLQIYAETFDDADAWNRLSRLSAGNQQWDMAVSSLLKLSVLQVSPEAYQATLKRLVQASSHVRAGLEKRGDQLGILALYQDIYDQHPEYPRFQLELAQAHLRLDNQLAARSYLETLQYDPEMGALAKQNLAMLDAKLDDGLKAAAAKPKAPASRGQIVVPLFRSGNSFLVDVAINAKPMRLLLDTGASITSLSSSAIQRLNLQPTGRSIKLSTANGLTNSQLYYAESLNLGHLRLKNVTVAEVEFGQNSRLQGLLGTDILNKMNDRFSYIIDNQQNALIFLAK